MAEAAAQVDAQELLEDARTLIHYAVRNRIDIPRQLLDRFNPAAQELERIRTDPAQYTAFIASFQELSKLVPLSAAQLRSMRERLQRLKPQIDAANTLLRFATENGRQIAPEVSAAIVAATDAAAKAAVTPELEASFLKAYQALATQLSPVTAATMAASRTKLPKFRMLLDNPEEFLRSFAGMTLGRFLHLAMFVLVLVVAGVALGYQAIGETALARHEALTTRIGELQDAIAKGQLSLREKQFVRDTELKKSVESQTARAAQSAFGQAEAELAKNQALLQQLSAERAALPESLNEWLKGPCQSTWTEWMCFYPMASARAMEEPQMLFLSQAAVRRMNTIVLPLLLGLLGAYSFVLRQLSREIRESSFAPDSLLHNVVRLTLGALAGLAASWLLKPEQLGLMSSVPAWTLAFVAGYAMELVFAFMDRVVAAFTNKSP